MSSLEALEREAAGMEEEEEPIAPEDALATAIEHLRGVSAENESLRTELAGQQQKEIALRESNRELEWKCRAGGGGVGPGSAAAMADEWRDMEQRLQVLVTENGLLENAQHDTQLALQREQANAMEMQASQAEALGAAQRARESQLAAEEETRKAHATTGEVRERLREQELIASTEARTVRKLKAELEAARAEAAAAHRDAIALQQKVDGQYRVQASATASASDRVAKLADERGKLHVELEATQRRAGHLAQDLAAAQATDRQNGLLIEGLGGELEATRQALRQQQAEADAAIAKAREAEGTVAELLSNRQEMARRLEEHSELLERQHEGAQVAAQSGARGHAEQLAEARSAAAREALVAEQAREELHGALEAANAKAARETRERQQLQRQLDAASTALASLRDAAAVERAAAGGETAEELRGKASLARARADEAQNQLEHARNEARTLRDETGRLRARAEGAEAEAEREQVRGRRAAAVAEAERDAMAVTLAQRERAAETALAEAAAAEQRVESERTAIASHLHERTSLFAAQRESLQVQLAERTEVVNRLQEMLDRQQLLAEQYRDQARQAMLKLRGGQGPPEQQLDLFDPTAASSYAAAAAASAAVFSAAVAPPTFPADGDGMLAELQAARARAEQSRRMLAAAALVVS